MKGDQMAEHVPPRVLVALMAFFRGDDCLRRWPSGRRRSSCPAVSGVIGLVGVGVTTIFGTFHILAAITGILLWQWERHRLRPRSCASRWRPRRSISGSRC
jgi:hypothetical protein